MMPSMLDILPVELLGKILALAACTRRYAREQWLVMSEAGKLMLVCKRWREAVKSAAFWQEPWVQLDWLAPLLQPSHTLAITRFSVCDLCSQCPGYVSCYRLPRLPQLKELQARSCACLLCVWEGGQQSAWDRAARRVDAKVSGCHVADMHGPDLGTLCGRPPWYADMGQYPSAGRKWQLVLGMASLMQACMCANSLLAPTLILLASMLPSANYNAACLPQMTFNHPSALRPLDLQALTQLTHLEVISEVGSCVAVSFPTQLRRVKIQTLRLMLPSWTSLSRCTGLQHLDCQLVEAPLISPEAFPRLQSLSMEVNSYDSSAKSEDEEAKAHAAVSWAAGLASRTERAALDLHDDASALMQPRFHGLHLHRLRLREECTEQVWQHLSIQHLVAKDFQGKCLTRDVLPASLVTGSIWADVSGYGYGCDSFGSDRMWPAAEF